METEYQNSDWIIPIVQKKYTINPNSSISALFRGLRKHPRFQLFGDYPLLAVIVKTIFGMGLNPKRNTITYALNESEELRQLPKNVKIHLLNELTKLSPVATKPAKKSSGKEKK